MERRVLANTIEYTKNPPGKETQSLANAVSSSERERTNSPLLRERVRVRGQAKTSFPFQIGKDGGVNRIGLLLPLQMGKNGGGKYNQFVVSTPSLEVRCKR